MSPSKLQSLWENNRAYMKVPDWNPTMIEKVTLINVLAILLFVHNEIRIHFPKKNIFNN